jgi:type I restriction-modification system DNA methylase subunit
MTMMKNLDELKDILVQLVAKVPEVEETLKHLPAGKAGRGKPEDTTKDKLIVPLLDALGFDSDHRTLEASMRRSGIGQLIWVDYTLKKNPDDRKGLALLEAKSLLEEDLWKKHKKQIRSCLHDYQLSLRTEDPVRWIILTNFREIYILNIADYEPFFKLTYKDYVENAALLYRLLNRDQLGNDQITSIYYEKRHVPLGKSFLNDLKLWRLLLANGLKQSQPDLTLEQTKSLSQQILNRIIFIRVSETYGLHPYYSLVRQYESWKRDIRNSDRFPFFELQLMRTFMDIELDLNTELFKNTLIEDVCAKLTDLLGHTVTQITIPNKYIRPLVDPDVYWPDKDQEIRELIGFQTGQQRYALSTPYNYDFHTLTQDIIGQVYEQFLAHNLVQEGKHILIRTDQSLRQQEGTYYTPMYVVRFLVEGTLGRLAMQILEEAKRFLHNKCYKEAQTAINQLKSIKVLDLACGSGSFLIAAFNTLMKAYELWNSLLETVMEKDFNSEWLRFIEVGLEKEISPGDSILHHNIFGVDRDVQAIGEAKLNMWLLLVRTQSGDYMRVDDRPPKRRLPDFSNNFVVADSLDLSFDIDALVGTESQQRIILGNPPWGADISAEGLSLDGFNLAKGQYDSYDLFIERVTQTLRPGDQFGYIVPDSILQLPQHAPLRELILNHYEINSLVKLGEGVFEDVFRAAVAFIFTRSSDIDSNHNLRSRIIVKAEREQLIRTSRDNAIQALLDKDGISITQARFNSNKEQIFDIFAGDEDMKVLQLIDSDAMNWEEVTINGRGVELSKNGSVMVCPHCGIWHPIAHKQKNGMYSDVKCINKACGRPIRYDSNNSYLSARIIMPVRTSSCTQPIIVGEGVNRYQIVETRFIDTSKVRAFPCCPNPNPRNPKLRCSFCDFKAPQFVPGEVRVCKKCGQKYTEADVQKWVNLGIDYKSPGFYEGEKLLVRKTGRGIYATIDRTGAYTVQVVYIFALRDDRSEPYQQLRLTYILGVLNSRMMLYRYYKALGDIEWKSFPYMTQKTIMQLPIRRIDFSDVRQTYFHNRIADIVDDVISSGRPPDPGVDAEIEQLVRELYGVNTPAANARIDSELERISQFGSLLGSSQDLEDEEMKSITT